MQKKFSFPGRGLALQSSGEEEWRPPNAKFPLLFKPQLPCLTPPLHREHLGAYFVPSLHTIDTCHSGQHGVIVCPQPSSLRSPFPQSLSSRCQQLRTGPFTFSHWHKNAVHPTPGQSTAFTNQNPSLNPAPGLACLIQEYPCRACAHLQPQPQKPKRKRCPPG